MAQRVERARAAGSANYLEELGLSELQLYNAVGNHFDHEALCSRLAVFIVSPKSR